MPDHDLIVIGGSAGGVEALTVLVAGLPEDLRAAVCVVVHLRAYGESRLASVLARSGPLPAVMAEHGAPLRQGTIHVAAPDMHLLVEREEGGGGVLRLTRGPRENRARPDVDPLFRSAALAFGPRVIGVQVSGALDDGVAGLWAIRDRGGLVVVQDPTDAIVSSMPRSALDEVGADHVAPAAALGPLLGRLAREPAPVGEPGPETDELRETEAAAYEPSGDASTVLAREVAMAAVDEEAHARSERYGVPSRFVCPDCTGVLWDVSGAGPLRYRCETGHAFSPASLAESQTESVEAALWAALRAIEDRVELARLRAAHAAERGLRAFVEQCSVQEAAAQQHAAVLRALLRLDVRVGARASEGASEGAGDAAGDAAAGGASAPEPGGGGTPGVEPGD